ncbi:hypothetical protein [Burkholderia sp. SIMBA_062]|uniref:hypothetical protein n=1 Tax=Burkholderia sp. SIMBA_062 TaxID=3085803 RepID=UPI00397DB141
MVLGAFREQSAKAGAPMKPANGPLQSMRCAATVPFTASLPGAQKKKAPEGAFNMLRLVRQADQNL